jgi:SSS family solute:Na+ symporter
MYGGFLLLLPIAVFNAGGIGAVRAQVPAESFSVLGGQTVGYVVAWYFIALQTLVEPTFFQRCFAAESPAVARRGLYVSIVFFAIFDGLTTFTGIYARALLPDLASGVDAFPRARRACCSPRACSASSTRGCSRPSCPPWTRTCQRGDLDLPRSRRKARAACRSIALRRARRPRRRHGIAVAFALSSSSVVNLWYGFGSVATAVLLAPIFGVFFPKLRPRASFVAPGMVVSGAVALAWVLSGLRAEGPWLGIEPVYPGLVVSCFIAAAGVVTRAGALAPPLEWRHTVLVMDQGPAPKSLAPGMLIAVPQLLDPNFRQSVVLLLQQSEEGAVVSSSTASPRSRSASSVATTRSATRGIPERRSASAARSSPSRVSSSSVPKSPTRRRAPSWTGSR